MILKNLDAILYLSKMTEEDEITLRIEKDLLSNVENLSSGSLSGEPPYHISGVALGPNDVTRGQSGEKKVWPASTLKDAAESLTGKNLVTDHKNTVDSVVGEVVESYFKEGKGVVFNAELDSKDIAEKIQNGRLDVSARVFHRDTDDLEWDEETGASIIDLAKFDNLSFVLKPGASASNSVGIGQAAALKES